MEMNENSRTGVNEDMEIDIENKYITYKKDTKFTIAESLYILKRKDFCDEVENIAIKCLEEFLEV